MNTNPQQLTDKKRTVRCVALLFILLCILPVTLNFTCLIPIHFSLNNNTLYSGGAIIITLDYLMDFFDLLSFTSVYSIIIFALVFSKKKLCAAVSISYVIFLILKIPARLLMNIPIYGTIGTNAEILVDVISLSFYFILELAQFLTVVLASSFIAKSYNSSIKIIQKKKKKDPEEILPIKKFVNWYNPLLRAAIYSSIIITAVRIFSRTISLLTTIPDNVILIITDYLSDLIFGFAAYIIFIFIFNLLYDKLTKPSKENDDKNKKENKADEKNSSALFED